VLISSVQEEHDIGTSMLLGWKKRRKMQSILQRKRLSKIMTHSKETIKA
jgi:hypothetical protein